MLSDEHVISKPAKNTPILGSGAAIQNSPRTRNVPWLPKRSFQTWEKCKHLFSPSRHLSKCPSENFAAVETPHSIAAERLRCATMAWVLTQAPKHRQKARAKMGVTILDNLICRIYSVRKES